MSIEPKLMKIDINGGTLGKLTFTPCLDVDIDFNQLI